MLSKQRQSDVQQSHSPSACPRSRQSRHPIADTHSFFSQVSHKNGCLAASLSRSFAHPPVAFGSIESEARTGQTVARPSRSGLFSNPEPPGNAEPQLGECFQNNAKATFSRVTRPQPAPGRDSRDTQFQTPIRFSAKAAIKVGVSQLRPSHKSAKSCGVNAQPRPFFATRWRMT